MKGKTTILEALDEIPPALCVLIARRNRKPIPRAEIRKASGLSRAKWYAILKANTFRDLTIAEADALRVACGITLANEWRHRAYIVRTFKSKTPLRHLRAET